MIESFTDSPRRWSRSGFLRMAAGASAAVAGGLVVGGSAGVSEAAAPLSGEDRRIFKFALLLEQLQATFYTEAARAGTLRGELLQFAQIVGGHERAHVAALSKALGPAAGRPPTFHFGNATRNPARFAAAARELENLGVAAYNGQGAKLSAGAMTQAAEIVSVEGRHAAWISLLAGIAPAPYPADPGLTAPDVVARLRATGFLG
jgi:Ferritin-like domain